MIKIRHTDATLQMRSAWNRMMRADQDLAIARSHFRHNPTGDNLYKLDRARTESTNSTADYRKKCRAAGYVLPNGRTQSVHLCD